MEKSQKRTTIVVCCLVCSICSLIAFGGMQQQQNQSQPQPPPKPQAASQEQENLPTFSVESAMVVVDITVRDSKGNLVDGLKREDFKVY